MMEKGWKAREDLHFEEAEKILHEVRDLFEKDKDWFHVTEALNHLAYNEKLKAVHQNLRGLELAEESMQVAKKHKIEKMLILRALMSLANSSGNYERALKYGLEALPLFKKPADKADILSHIATFQLRTGRVRDAFRTIKKAEGIFKKAKKKTKDPHRSIWESKILLTKALIMYNRNQLKRAKKLGEKALKLAKNKDLKTRKEEVRTFLKLLK